MHGSQTRRYATIFGTFAVALGIGFVMQNGDALASRLGVNDKPDAIDGPAQPVTANGVAQSLGTSDAGDTLVPNMHVPADEDGAAAGCAIHFEATPSVAAMVDLFLSAPCHPDTLVTLQHQGMKFNEMTDDAGKLAVQVPALSKEAYFVATVENTAGVVAITGVQDLRLYDRAVLQWRSADLLQLHALSQGASEGEEGHIWQASMGSFDADTGFLTRLGNPQSVAPLMVEVFSYPSFKAHHEVDLSVHAKVTLNNCGRTIAAQSIQVHPNQPPAARAMSLQMPDCEQVGEFLVLKNMFEDLTLASR